MNSYIAPTRDMLFILDAIAGLEDIGACAGSDGLNLETAGDILEESSRFAAEVLAPLDRTGDQHGCALHAGTVTTPPGWREAYARFRETGWGTLALPPEFGGQGLPKLLSTAVNEMWCAANLAFSLVFPLSAGATRALLLVASPALQHRYLPRLVSGEWTGTMCLTEAQAGSDLAAVRTRAEPQPDGSYRLYGQKIFITYGEHDLTENIVHLVLARRPDAPPGVKGISLFVVPKYLPAAADAAATRNDVYCVSIEHKLGIHGSPTCVLAFGAHSGAQGWLVGEVNRGLEHMFIMMNEARLATGLQGVAVGERAYQRALAYARARVQGRDALGGAAGVPIVRHPDVKRMLLAMRARVMAARMLAYVAAAMVDHAATGASTERAQRAQRFVELLTPIVKGWCAEIGNEVSYLGVQVHGGTGYIEETGAAQQLRDARIIPIYEGTTGIQANDLVGRKVLREHGVTLRELITDMRGVAQALARVDALAPLGAGLAQAVTGLEGTLEWMLEQQGARPYEVLAGAVPFLQLTGGVCGAWQMGRAALAAHERRARGDGPADYHTGLIDLARFYYTHVLPPARAQAEVVVQGGATVAAIADAAL